jgi:maleate isomerase
MTYEPIAPRARVGFIIPTSNRMVEPQAQRYLPADVTPHFTRIRMTNRHSAPIGELAARIVDAAEMLAESRCDVIALQCTGTSMSGGVEGEKTVMAAMEKATGRPAVSAASSVMAALGAVGARRIVFLSESEQAGHDKKLRFLREAGLHIVGTKAVGLSGTDEYCVTPPKRWFDETMAMRDDSADAYFVSCANIHSIDVIEELEGALGRPVVTSNQAAFWNALRVAGVRDDLPGLGRLGRIAKTPAER